MNKQTLLFIIISIMMAISTNSSAQQSKMSNIEDPIALFLEFQFEAEDMNFAIELLTEMQNQTIENEEGCIAYDILLNDEEPNTIYLYECYENKAALDVHNNAAYYKNIVDKQLSPLIKDRRVLKLKPINDLGIMM
ncbi:MAG TPA: antibiotic biosynthesis monooxygenase [Bacteroidales bacterium]|nr:antibiotic biosynthesis monooxygenase [Bacteroidales bacterium]